MSKQSLRVIGGGEHARVVIEAALSRGDMFDVDGFIDPQICGETTQRFGTRWLGNDDDALAAVALDQRYVLGIGAIGVNGVRRRLVERYTAAGATFATIVHLYAMVSPTASYEPGAVVLAGAVLQSGARIGRHGLVGTGSIIEHDVQLGDFVQTGPGVVIGGGVTVGEGSYLGLGARIRDHVTIGKGVMVAMGAVVTRNVGDGETVMGIPARRR